MLMEITLTFSRNPSSTCDNACPTSRLTPPRIRMSVIDRTAARLTARFRQKLCQALFSANLRFRNIIVVPARPVISGNLPSVDRNNAAAEEVDDLTVVRRHDDRGASLLLAARKVRGIGVLLPREAHRLQRLGGARLHQTVGLAEDAQREGHVL